MIQKNLTKEFYSLEIELLDKCNLRCKLCNRIELKETSNYLKPNEVYQRIKEINPTKIIFMGNKSEPIMYYDKETNTNLIKLIKEIQFQFPDIQIELYTNGTAQKIDFWKELNQLKPISIYWALAGTSQEEHQIYRKNKLSEIVSNVGVCYNHVNIALYIMFEYNNINKPEPIKHNQLKYLSRSIIFQNFDFILYIHTGDFEEKDIFKPQDIKKWIIPTDKNYQYRCQGNSSKFLSETNEIYFCKYQGEQRIRTFETEEDKYQFCKGYGCTDIYLTFMFDKLFRPSGEYIGYLEIFPDKTFDIEKLLELKLKVI